MIARDKKTRPVTTLYSNEQEYKGLKKEGNRGRRGERRVQKYNMAQTFSSFMNKAMYYLILIFFKWLYYKACFSTTFREICHIHIKHLS